MLGLQSSTESRRGGVSWLLAWKALG